MQFKECLHLTSANLFEVQSAQVFRTSAAAAHLGATIGFALRTELPLGLGSVHETFNITVGASQLAIDVGALLAVDESRFDGVQIGALKLDPSGCLLSLLFAANLTMLRATVADILDPLVAGLFDRTASRMISQLTTNLIFPTQAFDF